MYVATGNWHVHFLTLFVTRPKCFRTGNVGSAASGKVKTFTGTVLGLLLFFAYSQKFSIDTPESFILLSFTTAKSLKEVKPPLPVVK